MRDHAAVPGDGTQNDEPLQSGATRPSGGTRREFLGASVGAAGLGALSPAAREDAPSKYLPEEQWRARMTAPDDGKRYGWVVDTRRCFGCHGCEVACKAENDVPLGSYIRQTIYHDHTRANGAVARIAAPMSCQHCEDAPCIKACPCGALHKGPGGSVQVDYGVCSGHAACKEVCPYGAIYIDPVANQAVKCHNCTHRVDVGMEPACVETCPSGALYFGDLNDPNSSVSRLHRELEGRLEVLREERGTQPRMRFVVDEAHPLAAWEPKVPREGESYRNDAYSVYEWGEPGFDGADAEGGAR
ncbi:MAG: 4Fe-4S dicluster domain-containing protein [Planctomycetes bacterium]|nr:4Fe-4S dicluster domain-containing protein [Planctomycetota bacterium]